MRNFKILFIKGDENLLKNKNLKFNLDNEESIQKSLDNFIDEVAGY